MLSYGFQSINDDDLAAVADALCSGYLTTGPKVAEFEQRFAAMTGAKHAIAVCNATAALHLAMRVAGIGPGDRVVTSPNTFLASANCAAYVGATPDFSDIDPVSFNLDPALLEANWQPDTKAVIAVDYAGQTAEMPRIAEIARKHGALVIEDACHAVGGGFEHEGQIYKVGGHPWADMTVFSFHPVKTMTTGEGGMLVTDNAQFAKQARLLRTHGVVRDPSQFNGLGWDENPAFAERGPWYYEMTDLGWNDRITDFQCALGISQLNQLADFTSRRREIVAQYNAAFSAFEWLSTPKLRNLPDRELISWHLYSVQIDFQQLGKTRTQVMQELREQGVGTQVLYIPVHLQPWYRRTYGYSHSKCPNAESFYEQALSLPLYPALRDENVAMVIESIKKMES